MQIKLEFIMNFQRVPKTTEKLQDSICKHNGKRIQFLCLSSESQTHTEIQHHQNPIIRMQRSTNSVPRVDLVFRI